MLQKAVHSRFASMLILFVLYWIVAAASVSGSLGKWALRDGEQNFGIEQILNEQASRPFVYRRLLPEAADFAERITPQSIKLYVGDKLSPHRTFARASAAGNPEYAFRYVVMAYLCLGASLLTLFVLSALLRDLGFARQTTVMAPMAFVLAFPFLQTVGGYFYDSVELFFLSAAALLAVRGYWIVLVALAVPATLNKEAFFFFVPSLYPLLRIRRDRKTALAAIVATVAVSGIVNAWIKWLYAGARGDVAHLQLLNNIEKYFYLPTFTQFEVTYGMVGPSGAFLGTLLVMAIIVIRGWPTCPRVMRQHLIIGAALNLPLFLIFCAPGELRNLSMLFVGFVVLLACVSDSVSSRFPLASADAKRTSSMDDAELSA